MQELLEGVQFLDGFSSPYAIVEECEEHDALLAVSDGLVILHNMSYGWVVATPDGKILAWSAGPCNGQGNSRRAEGVVPRLVCQTYEGRGWRRVGTLMV